MIIETISIEISKEKVYDINIEEKEEIFQNGKFRNDKKYDYYNSR